MEGKVINQRLSHILKGLAIIYAGLFTALTLLAAAGFWFNAAHATRLLNFVCLGLVVPVAFGLYLNHRKQWANLLAFTLPLMLLLSPMPIELPVRFIVFLVSVVPFFASLPSARVWKRWLAGLPIGIIALAILATSPIWTVFSLPSWGRPDLIHRKISPDRVHQIELVSQDVGALSGQTRVDLYRNYPGLIIRRFERNMSMRDDWPARDEIKWIDNEIVEIRGERFYIDE